MMLLTLSAAYDRCLFGFVMCQTLIYYIVTSGNYCIRYSIR